MFLRPVLILIVATFLFSCKKDKHSEEDKIAGSYSAVVQMQTSNTWPSLNIDSIKSGGRVNYVLNSDRTGFVSKVESAGSGGIIIYDPTKPIDMTLKTHKCYWEYYSNEKKLIIQDSLHQVSETWKLDEINNSYLTSVAEDLQINIGTPGIPVYQRFRVVLVKK